ncbi:Dimer_Tnp_hAT domain-containing protein/DUF4413 domain-containing protein [Cephalotus follicularis]|uniref:Dimer_Tnp_hAT domain-containing protein/DUF4413 domain-containing protein n=1 Tax=Cephalotus follicularis TaxID=3775 RepID=A0A1Q3D7R9_CEPFO|nr:Dimer_Tnp_hAT domain-containing protein/DUF4413 domain-containing protein [Cephalotus follicularis]
MANKMLVKFEKYWDAVRGIMAVACVLDPRYKMCLLEYFYEQIYGPERYEAEIEKINTTCFALLHEYQLELSTGKGVVGSSNISSSSQLKSDKGGTVLEGYDKYVGLKKRKKTYVKSELKNYLEEDVLPREETFDILAWWKSNGIKYPTLQTIARDIYAIPVSTVASESTFSMGGKLVSPHRSRLHLTTVEALACTQSWLWADIGGMQCNHQFITFNELVIFYFSIISLAHNCLITLLCFGLAESKASNLLPSTVGDDRDDDLNGEEESEIVDLVNY